MITKLSVIQFVVTVISWVSLYGLVPAAIVIFVACVWYIAKTDKRKVSTREIEANREWSFIFAFFSLLFILWRVFMALPDGVSAQ